MMMNQRFGLLALAAVLFVLGPASPHAQDKPAREIDIEDVSVPDGYRIETAAINLTVPTTAVFDGDDLLVAESGYNNTGQPRIVRVRKGGATEVVVSRGLNPPVTGVAARNGTIYVSHAGKVSIVQGSGLKDILTDLPHGDHHNNKIVFGPDGKIYMGQGTMTNTGVVGIDNYLFGWLKERPQQHEVPCKDITLTGENFETENPLTEADDKVTTGAYKPFGTPSTPGETIRGNPKCGGSIVRFNANGSGFELVAWGLRNPFGVQFDQAGQLWTTNHGADVRGSRNVFNDPDYLVRVEEGAWYGFPDYFDGRPVTDARFNAPEKAKPTFLWRDHPQRSQAFVTFASHTGTNGLAFSPGGAFGFAGDAFIAAYGTFAPVTTGININPVGFGVLRVNMKTREVETFVKNDLPGPAYLNGSEGLNRPSDVLFGPDGSLYIVDWGAATLDTSGLKLVPRTGVIWRVFKEGQAPLYSSGAAIIPSGANPPEQIKPMVPNVPETYRMASGTLALLIGGVVLLVVAVVFAWKAMSRRARES
jgi:glucose/arabinose dehydrogenase